MDISPYCLSEKKEIVTKNSSCLIQNCKGLKYSDAINKLECYVQNTFLYVIFKGNPLVNNTIYSIIHSLINNCHQHISRSDLPTRTDNNKEGPVYIMGIR